MPRQSFFQGWRRKTLTAVTVTVDVDGKMACEMKSCSPNIKATPKVERRRSASAASITIR